MLARRVHNKVTFPRVRRGAQGTGHPSESSLSPGAAVIWKGKPLGQECLPCQPCPRHQQSPGGGKKRTSGLKKVWVSYWGKGQGLLLLWTGTAGAAAGSTAVWTISAAVWKALLVSGELVLPWTNTTVKSAGVSQPWAQRATRGRRRHRSSIW